MSTGSKRQVPALLLVVALLLSACGGAATAPTATPLALPTTPPESAATTVPAEPAATTEAMAGSSEKCNLRPFNVTLNATGASFPNPVYQKWIESYKTVNPGVTINYQSTGSGQGKSDYIGGVTDFGGSDALFSPEEKAKAPDTLFIPTVLGAVVATYNLEGVSDLRFSPETLASIFLGKITTWTDPAIVADNPGVTLPDQPITVAHRSDGSGTTFIFTDYLSKVSKEWEQQVGRGTAVEWPTGIGGEKNDGVAAAVKQTPGAVGYVELIYALANDLPAPAIKNAAGEYVKPSLETTTNAAAGFLKNLPADLQFTVTNPPEGKDSYPIAGFTWLLVHPNYDDVQKAEALTDFICWALTEGDQIALSLRYAPLPAPVEKRALELLETVKADGKEVFIAPK
ncbi:MAG TPA: phosphate ABC transporter substrate-binding protein PstS [Chloroflexi bacterium]|nr:phosphate ABC transporter substrate-binding protein PstS [Chloroflexota bacterium]